MSLSEKRKFQNRMAKRSYKHGKNWRQVFVDCAGMCISKDEEGMPCGHTDGLQFHEPFGEDRLGWGILQARVLLCTHHHTLEHERLFGGEGDNWFIHPSCLDEDMDIEIQLHGGYDQWIKDFNLQDTFGRLLYV